MSDIFDTYAAYYDLLYADKEYGAECDLLETIFERRTDVRVERVLDCACGTGSHAIELAGRGYDVTGFDRSEQMVEWARGKATTAGVDPALEVGDLRDFEGSGRFDAAICMFASLGYVTDTDGVLETLQNIRSHLVDGGVLIFDFWNGLAVMNIGPEQRIKDVSEGNRRVIRTVEPELNSAEHVCNSHYSFLVVEDDTVTEEFEETHRMIFFFPR